jgi:hypothetical protein
MEARRDSMGRESDFAKRLWYGHFDGKQWTSLEQLPLPVEGRLIPHAASSLVRSGDTLAWATKIELTDQKRGVIIFSKYSDSWTYEILPIGGTAYVELAHSGTLGFMLAVVQADRSMWSDTSSIPASSTYVSWKHDRNSLFFYTRRHSWQMLRKVVAGGQQPVHVPIVTISPTGGILTWLADVANTGGMVAELRAMAGNLENQNEHERTLASDVIRFAQQSMPGGAHLVVAEVHQPNNENQLQFLTVSPASASSLAQIPNPFLENTFSVAVTQSATLLLAGGLLRRVDRDAPIVTQLIHANINCETN